MSMQIYSQLITEQALTALKQKGIKAKAKIGVTQNKKHEVISFWEYDDEAHMKTVRSTLAKFSALPNSLSPKEVSFQADVVNDLFVDQVKKELVMLMKKATPWTYWLSG